MGREESEVNASDRQLRRVTRVASKAGQGPNVKNPRLCRGIVILPKYTLKSISEIEYLGFSVQTVPSIFIVFGNFFSSFYTSSTRTNNYSMTKIFGNLSCADIVCRKIVYIYTFLDEKKKNFSVYCTPYRVH